MKSSLSKGFVSMASTEVVVMFSNYFIHIFLARYLGIEAYGIFGVLMSLYLINRAFLNTGIPRTVTKFISESNVLTHSFYVAVLKLQLFLATVVTVLYLLLAPYVASWLHDSSLVGMIRFVGLMIIPLALLALYTSGYMNGLRVFREQAIISFSLPIFRLVFVFLFVFLGLGLFGALLGYFLSVVCCLILFFIIWKNPVQYVEQKEDNKSILKKVFLFSLPLTLSALAGISIRNMNVLFVKAMLIDNTLTGLYTAATTLSNIPFLLFMYLPFVLMPSISRSIAIQNKVLTQKYIKQSLRWLLLLMLPIIGLMAATSEELLRLFYSSSFSSAAGVLRLLVFSVTFLVIYSTLGSIITGSGKPKVEMGMTIFLLGLMILLNLYFIPHYGLLGAGYSSVITTFVGMVVAGVYVYEKFGVLVNLMSTVKIVVSSVMVYYLASLWHFKGVYLGITYGLMLLFYICMLWLFKEIKKEDVSIVVSLLWWKNKSNED